MARNLLAIVVAVGLVVAVLASMEAVVTREPIYCARPEYRPGPHGDTIMTCANGRVILVSPH